MERVRIHKPAVEAPAAPLPRVKIARPVADAEPLPRVKIAKATEAPAAEGPFSVGDYLDVNMGDDCPVGSGYRLFLVIHVYPRKKEVRLFYAPTLEAFDYDIAKLGRNKTLRKEVYTSSRLAKQIRRNRTEHETLGMRVTSDTDTALQVLKERKT